MDRDEFPDKISIDDLYTKKKVTEEHKIQCYKKILNRVHSKIKTTSRMRGSDRFCFFLLPEFVLGVPRYDMVKCTSYVIEKLIDNGFMVKYTHPNLLFISWQHYIPSYERAQIKKKTGVSVDQYGNVVSKKDKKKDNDSLNGLLLKNTAKNTILKKKEDKNKNYKSIDTYKPTGNLIYNTSLLNKIEDTVNLKK